MNNFELKDKVFLTLLFIAAFWLWTLPLQNNPMPFGEHDGAYIFSHGDQMSYIGRTEGIRGEDYPTSILFWYSGYNKVLGPTSIEYPPPYLVDYALVQVFGGERIIPAYIFIAITCFLGIFAMYLLVRKLYGFEPAVITSISLMFSFRAISLYLWGQRHNLIAFVFIPITVYALYKYLTSFYNSEKEKGDGTEKSFGSDQIIYLYVFALLILSTYLVHLSATVFLVPFCVMFALLMAIKYKRLPFLKKNLVHYGIILVFMLAVIIPFYPIYFGSGETVNADPGMKDFGSLFQWLKLPGNLYDMNPAFTDFNTSYMGKWFLIPLFIGLLVMVLRRKDSDLAMLSSFVALYAMFHLPAFGLVEIGNYRIGRYLVVENYFFFATVAIGLMALPSFIPTNKDVRKYLRYAIMAAFLFVVISSQGNYAKTYLNDAYQSISRITPAQYEVSEWISENVPEYSAVHLMGTLTYAKKAYMQILSRRVVERTDNEPDRRIKFVMDVIKPGHIVPDEIVDGDDMVIPMNHIVFDYSDLYYLMNNPNYMQMAMNIEEMEKSLQDNLTLIYNKNNIRVYEFD